MEGSTFDPTLKTPFTFVCSGPTQAGKSQLTKEIIRRKDEIFDPPIHNIVFCYGVKQPPLHNELKRIAPQIRFHEGLPSEYGDDLRTPYLYVLDDLMHECSKSKDVMNAFVRGSHHRNVSILFLTQNFFHDGLRILTTNSKYICLFKNPSETQVVNKVGQRMNCGRKNEVMEDAFKQCVSVPHGYLFIDCSQNQNENFRLRNNIFPDSNCVVFTKR